MTELSTELSYMTVLDTMLVYASARKYGLMRIGIKDIAWSLTLS